ncbi:hypothetical protein A9Z07_01685 [Acinetobacter sp. YK3]|nr:hypothetical protein A9Z07_01685 [Acinetobacter sp. YK3]
MPVFINWHFYCYSLQFLKHILFQLFLNFFMIGYKALVPFAYSQYDLPERKQTLQTVKKHRP